MYLIFLILSILGISAPYSVNESKHGEAHYDDTSKVMADMMARYHARSEAICLNAGDMDSCQGGTVRQTGNLDGTAKNTYGSGIASVSNGKDNVITFVPESNQYKFDPNNIKGDVYGKLGTLTGRGLNAGYYDASLSQIVLKNGTTVPIPTGMSAYRIYDHMPVLYTNLNGSTASYSRGAAVNPKNMNVIDSIESGTKSYNQVSTGYTASRGTYSCADGTGITINGAVLCDSSLSSIPSPQNNSVGKYMQQKAVSTNQNYTANPQTGNAANDSEAGDDNANDTYGVNFSNNGTMTMGTSGIGGDNNQAGTQANPTDGSNEIDVSAGGNIPMVGSYIKNCQNVTYPNADSSGAGYNNLGYSYTYDYYVDLGTCNAWVLPSLDNTSGNYAVTPQDTGVLSTLGWGTRISDYNWFDWFGTDIEGTGVHNPQSGRWDGKSTDCNKNYGFDIYNANYGDLETVYAQTSIYGITISQTLTGCSVINGQETVSSDGSTSLVTEGLSYGSDNGIALNSANEIIDQLGTAFGNTGPYLETPFTYWGMQWMCKPDSKDQQDQYLHYHVTCAPNISITQQSNDYTGFSTWKMLVGNGNYPYGGLFSFGHKGSTNLGGAPINDISSLAINSSGNTNYGVSATGTDYMGQAFGAIVPFAIQTTANSYNGTEGVTALLQAAQLNNAVNCNSVNPSASTDTIPTGSCSGLMNGIPFAFNKKFFNFEQAILQQFSSQMQTNGWASASSTLDNSIVSGTAGYPAQDGDGVWRWHVAPLTAPSFAAPSGNKLNGSSSTINKGDYFVISGEVPVSYSGIYSGIGASVSDTSGVPSTVGWKNGSINGANTQGSQTITNNGYTYSCSVGTYQGYDYATGELEYTMNCTVTSVPPPPSAGPTGGVDTGADMGRLYNMSCSLGDDPDGSNNYSYVGLYKKSSIASDVQTDTGGLTVSGWNDGGPSTCQIYDYNDTSMTGSRYSGDWYDAMQENPVPAGAYIGNYNISCNPGVMNLFGTPNYTQNQSNVSMLSSLFNYLTSTGICTGQEIAPTHLDITCDLAQDVAKDGIEVSFAWGVFDSNNGRNAYCASLKPMFPGQEMSPDNYSNYAYRVVIQRPWAEMPGGGQSSSITDANYANVPTREIITKAGGVSQNMDTLLNGLYKNTTISFHSPHGVNIIYPYHHR